MLQSLKIIKYLRSFSFHLNYFPPLYYTYETVIRIWRVGVILLPGVRDVRGGNVTTPGPPRSGQRSLGSCSPGCLRCEALGCVKCTGVIVHGSRECRAECPPGFQQHWSTVVDYMGLLCTGACVTLYSLPFLHAAGPDGVHRMHCSFSIKYVTYKSAARPQRDALWWFAQLRSFLRIVVFLFRKSRASVCAFSFKWGNYSKSKLLAVQLVQVE